jgi:hypothetical protein
VTGPVLAGLSVADPVSAWEGLGFSVRSDVVWLGGVAIGLGGAGVGITGWSLSPDVGEVDGLPRCTSAAGPPISEAHENGALGLDHVVVTTPSFERTGAALESAGMPFRRVRSVPAADDRPGFRQGFRRLGPAILEVVEAVGAPPGPATFWGLVVIVADLDALAARLGPDVLGTVRPAVQPGRQIATVRRGAGLSAPMAFMDPEP